MVEPSYRHLLLCFFSYKQRNILLGTMRGDQCYVVSERSLSCTKVQIQHLLLYEGVDYALSRMCTRLIILTNFTLARFRGATIPFWRFRSFPPLRRLRQWSDRGYHGKTTRTLASCGDCLSLLKPCRENKVQRD